ncbi:hypothetical protein [Sphingomonas sp. MMS24-J13]|uniref:hypothetical protein n=1 Tax=Sphingomonas sp. MMS24-J13 TaxID=3238686 RepID=UPI00384E674E
MHALQVAVDNAPIEVSILDIHVEASSLLESAASAGHEVDLVLIGPDPHWQSSATRRKVIDALLFHSGSPCLLYPADGTAAPFARAVLAWDGTAGAARAARLLPSVIAPKAHVDVLVVDPPTTDAAAEELAGARIAAHLRRHHFEVDLHLCPAGGRSIADVIQGFSASRSADLLVAGAYGHSHWRERLAGGVTRDLIDGQRIPTLIGG